MLDVTRKQEEMIRDEAKGWSIAAQQIANE